MYMVWVVSLSFPSSSTQNGSLFPGEGNQQSTHTRRPSTTDNDLAPQEVPFRSAASRSVALRTLTCRKPTSLGFVRDFFRHWKRKELHEEPAAHTSYTHVHSSRLTPVSETQEVASST